MREIMRKLWLDDEAQDLIEYALIAGLVSLICYTTIQAGGQAVSSVWNNVSTALASSGS